MTIENEGGVLSRSRTCPRSPLKVAASREQVSASEGMPPQKRVPSTAGRCSKTFAMGLLVLLAASFIGCGERDSRTVITIWHQSRPAEYQLLREEIARFEQSHPQVRVRALYKETEELRSGFQAAALAGGGPELVYGPSDVLGALQTMGVVQDLSKWFPASGNADFVEGALTYLPSRNDATKSERLEPEALNETNMLELYVFASEKHRQALLVARLDNLGKGASGAAVQNMRLMLGFAET